MKTLNMFDKYLIYKLNTGVLADNKLSPANRYAGADAPDGLDCTAFHSKRSLGYASRCKTAPSNPPGAPSSDIFMQYPG